MFKIITNLAVTALLFSTSANAVTIRANDLKIGTEVTSLDGIAMLNRISGTLKQVVSIQNDAESHRNTIGAHTGILDDVSPCNVFLCGRPMENLSQGLLIEVIKPINFFSFKGFDRSTDSFDILFFDENDSVLAHERPTIRTTRYYDCGNAGFPCNEFNYYYESGFDLSKTKKIYFGGTSAGAYVTEITIRVPEPSTWSLLIMGLLLTLAVNFKSSKMYTEKFKI